MIDAYLSSLTAPFQVDTLLDVRTSKMKSMPGLTIMSGIDKASCNRPMKVSKLGLEGDEHDLTFHGGADKAILGCKSYMPVVTKMTWKLMTERHGKTARLTTIVGENRIQSEQKDLFPEGLARTL